MDLALTFVLCAFSFFIGWVASCLFDAWINR